VSAEREAGAALLVSLASQFPREAGVTSGRMFNGIGLRVGQKFFGVVTSEGRLMVKLAAGDVDRLAASGHGDRVTMGTRTMREWVSVAQPTDDDPTSWWTVLVAARDFVARQ
jgi:TfoX/Sxy family transcriptional regulator of competence genes